MSWGYWGRRRSPLIGDQSTKRIVHGLVQVERSVLQILRGGHKGRRYAPWSGSALTSWRHSIGGRLIRVLRGRNAPQVDGCRESEISPARDQTPICLHGRDWLNANLGHPLWGIQRGSAAAPLSRSCGTTTHILQQTLCCKLVRRRRSGNGSKTHISLLLLNRKLPTGDAVQMGQRPTSRHNHLWFSYCKAEPVGSVKLCHQCTIWGSRTKLVG